MKKLRNIVIAIYWQYFMKKIFKEMLISAGSLSLLLDVCYFLKQLLES